MENETDDVALVLSDSLQALGKAIEDMSAALKRCREMGMSQEDIRNTIMLNIPENERASFNQQWPMLSMMFTALAR